MMTTDRIWQLMARKLAEEASPAEIQELEQLLRIHPDLHMPVETITDCWRYRAENSDADLLEEAYNHHLHRMQEMGVAFTPQPEEGSVPPAFLIERELPSRKQRYLLWTVAASLVLITGWILFSLSARPFQEAEIAAAVPVSEISTRNGSRTSVHLPDGSQVWLNAGSKLTYDKTFGTEKREVSLTGEAFFDVARNPGLPFIIHTTHIDVKVLGTQFNVKSYPNEKTTEAALVNGSIEVSLKDRPTHRIILKENEKIVVNADSSNDSSLTDGREIKAEKPAPVMVISKLEYVAGDSSPAETSWVQNKLVFKDESFTELATRMERWYGIEIGFADRSLETLRFTGTFENESISQALKALQITAGFSFRFTDNKTIIISK